MRASCTMFLAIALAACGGSSASVLDAPRDGVAADASDPAVPLPPLPLSASGRWIVGPDGKRFKLASVNWYGAEEKDFAVAGLQVADVHAIAKRIRAMGFNSVRLPWSNELVETNPVVPDYALAANPQLAGKHALDVLDAVVDALAHEGLLVILDNHGSRADWCCSDSDGNGLWYTNAFPESSWIADWRTIVTRYASQPAVVGADLRNEPRSIIEPASCTTCTQCPCAQNSGCTCKTATWGGVDPTVDWRGAATRGANAVLSINPNLLVFVEGTSYASDLTGVYGSAIDLGANQHRLVYSAHDYSFFHDALDNMPSPQYSQLHDQLGNEWGYILVQNQTYTAPIWVSEFGTCHSGASCLDGTNGIGWWFMSFRRYIREADIDWSYWAINGTQATGTGRTYGSEESYGILDLGWTNPALGELLVDLQALEAATQGP